MVAEGKIHDGKTLIGLSLYDAARRDRRIVAFSAGELLGRQLGDDLFGDFGRRFQRVEVLVGEGLAQAAEAALALLVVLDGLQQVDAAEVGPEAVGDEDLRVGDLPQQEVRDALLARGADDQVGVGHVPRVEVVGDVVLVEARSRPSTWRRSSSEQPRWWASAMRSAEDRARRVDNLRARTVVQRQRKVVPVLPAVASDAHCMVSCTSLGSSWMRPIYSIRTLLSFMRLTLPTR
jgi:hypothetical protein